MATSSNLPYSKIKIKKQVMKMLFFVHFINLFKFLSVQTDNYCHPTHYIYTQNGLCPHTLSDYNKLPAKHQLLAPIRACSSMKHVQEK